MSCVVKKRNGTKQTISSNKLKRFMSTLCGITPPLQRVRIETLLQTMNSGFASHMDARDIPNYVSDVASSFVLDHYEYGYLAGRAIISKLHKETPERFSYFVKASPFLSDEFKRRVAKNATEIDNMIVHNRDYHFDIFGIKTLQRSYLLKENNRFVERPQYMYMRVAVMVGETLPRIQETYEALSQHRYTHATPTLFHAGFKKQQLASCFLMTIAKDSIDSIFNTIKKAANISKGAGGIGLAISNVRGKGSLIKGTGGTSNGIVPMIKVINETMRYVDQCVLPSTIVYTLQGPKQIQYLSNGDKIIHESSIEEIQNVLEHPIEKASMRVIHTMHSIEPLTITEEHPVFALKDIGKAYNFNEIKKRLDNHSIAPDWIDAKDLQTRDFIAYPIPQYQKDIPSISEDDCYFYGVLLGDGHLNQRSMYGHITFHTIDKQHIGDFLKCYFDSKCIQYDESVEGNTSRIRWNKTTILPIKYGDIYDMNKEKHVSPKWLHLPCEKISKIVQGLMDTDGCVGKEIVFDSTSRNLIESMRYMCLRLGMLTSGYVRDRVGQCHQTAKGPITNRKISYTLRIPKTETSSYFQHNNMLFTRVQNIEKTEHTGTLYDLQFQKDHSYITHNGLIHNGGGKRKGSCALYLEPHHPDILDFLQMKKPNGLEEHRARDLFYAVYLSDVFMERVKDDQMWSLIDPNECPALQDAVGDQYRSLYQQLEKENRIVKSIRARQLWFDILDAQTETGTPYILYKDACNLKSNQNNLGTIRSSNLCVSPDTLILTSNGFEKIKRLSELPEDVQVWNGEEFTNTRCVKTGENQSMVRVTFSNGLHLDCTEYHKFYIQRSYSKKDVHCVRAHELTPGMKLIKWTAPVIDRSKKTMKYPYTHGLFCADGTYSMNKLQRNPCRNKVVIGTDFCKRHMNCNKDLYESPDGICKAISGVDKPILYLYGEKKLLLPHISIRTTSNRVDKQGRINISLPFDIKQKFYVPVDCTMDTRLRWLEGYLDGDGCVCVNQNCQSIQVISTHKEFLTNIVLMLQTMGVHSCVKASRKAGYKKLPDGKGGHKKYLCKDQFRLIIASAGLNQLISLGFSPKRLQVSHHNANRSATHFVKVSNVESIGCMDTYCFKEEKRGMGIFNGVITGQCAEILEYTSEKEVAVCTLASIALNKFVKNNQYDFEALAETTKLVVRNLDRCIDCTYYPIKEAKTSNNKHRPMGIGVQALADVFALLKMPYESEQAAILNKQIFETMYYAALTESHRLATVKGAYDTFEGSPLSKGQFQFDLWGKQPLGMYDWNTLRGNIQRDGVRHSLLLALMPTASTAQIMGNTESFEPRTSNLYTRRVLSGEYVVVNKQLQDYLYDEGLWMSSKDQIIRDRGSVKNLPVSQEVKDVFKTVWEISQKSLINMAADRGIYIDQTQSFNLYVAKPSRALLSTIHMYTWKKGLKTGCYYLRSRPAADAIQFTVAVEEDNDVCMSCSS